MKDKTNTKGTKRSKLFATIGTLLVIVGIGILGYAGYVRYDSSRVQKEMEKEFNEVLKQTEDSQKENASSDSPVDSPNVQRIGTIGRMIIPKINLSIFIGEGVEDNVLKYSAGHFPETVMPGEKGNTAFAGHRNHTYNSYFNRLNELSKGDEIIIETKNGEFTYIVTETKIVEPSEVSVLENTTDATITLVTCHPIRQNTQRLIVKGTLKN